MQYILALAILSIISAIAVYRYRTAVIREREVVQTTQLLLESSPMLMESLDEELNIIDCNQRTLDIFGLTAKDEYIQRHSDFTPRIQPCGTPTTEKIRMYMKETLQNGSARFEWMRQLPDGSPLPVEMTSLRITRGGKPIIVIYSHDLRPIKAAMEKERDQEISGRMRLMFDAAPLMIEFWDTNFRAIDCNQATLEYFGFKTKDEYLEYSLEKHNDRHDISLQIWQSHLREIFENGIGNFEFTEVKPSGEVCEQEVVAVRVIIGENFVVVTYSNDVTKLREMQRDLQRTEIAEESNRAKSRFLARMSHEIRTPITAVLGISEIELQDPYLPPNTGESFAKIHLAADTLLGIVNDILDLSKIESGMMTVLCEEYNVEEMISYVEYLHLVTNKDIEFRISVDENLPAVLIGDALRIQQIMSNLLSNAFKYTEAGTVDLAFDCEKIGDGYINLVISVRDTGFGMSKSQVENLFEDYTRFHEREHRFIEGTGLGMSIIYNLAEILDAKIEIESEVGKGTFMRVSIPQKTASINTIGPESARKLEEFEVGARTAEKRLKFAPEPMPYGSVLVVDDVETNIYVAQGLLSLYDLNIETCENGYEALEKIKQGKVYDLIFMDYMMPGINGVETMQAMRDTGYAGPIVVLTANAMIGQAEEFMSHGFDGFISKPIQFVHLNSALMMFIKDKQPPEVIKAAKMAQGPSPLLPDQQKLRVDFARDQENAAIEIHRAISSGDIPNAHRLAHTLKGLAGLIGENALAHTAEQAELLLAKGEVPVLTELEYELQKVISKLPIHSVHPVHPANKEMQAIQTILEKLGPLLESGDAECLSLLDEGLKNLPEAAVLVRQVENFEFEQALVTLKVLREVVY